MARMAMLIDLTRCIGCDACTVACKQENGTPVDVFFARVLNIEYGDYPNVKRMYLPVLCNHCDDAPCLKACPNKAIIRRPDGIVLIDQDRCKGTGACVSACPYGNIYLRSSGKDEWYLADDEPYEKDFVKPRLRCNVARKCTYCAHRVDEGLDPACVVACPTTARIFGDLDDPDSVISKYIVEQREFTGRETFHLLPQAKTKPAGCYLGPMAEMNPSTLGGRAEGKDPIKMNDKPETHKQPSLTHSLTGAMLKLIGVLVFVLMFLSLYAITEPEVDHDTYSTTTCVGCHGVTGMGGLGPPIVETDLTLEKFKLIVREGKGMMPATPVSDLSDEDIEKMYVQLKNTPLDESQIPLSFQVGRLMSTRNVGIIFLFVFGIAFLLSINVIVYWLKCAGLTNLFPYIKKLGFIKSTYIVASSLILDGFFVRSLWKTNKHRWFMHGLMLYGFFGLMLADVLIQIYNPTRAEMPLISPLKMLPIVSGMALMLGVFYVMYRYRSDKYIDNGLTMGRDFLFLNLMFHTVISGFLTMVINRTDAFGWVMPIYIYHLVSIALLILTAPFTRFSHAFVVPVLIDATRLTEAVGNAKVDLGFQREPTPGKHHKNERIAQDLVKQLDPNFKGSIRIRYYP